MNPTLQEIQKLVDELDLKLADCMAVGYQIEEIIKELRAELKTLNPTA